VRIVRIPFADDEWASLRRLFFRTFKKTVRDPKKFADFLDAALVGVTREILKGRTISSKKILDTIRQLAEGAGALEDVAEGKHDKHHEDLSKEKAPSSGA